MVIDIHTHCFSDKIAARAVRTLAQRSSLSPFTDGTVDGLKNSMTKSGVDISVVQTIATKPDQTTGINRWAYEVQDKNILCFGTIHPECTEWLSEIKWLAEMGFKGVKFHPDYQNFFVDEPRLLPIYQSLFEHGLVILFHAGIDVGLPRPYHCTPQRLVKVIDLFPGSKIVAAHMGGWRSWDDVEKYLMGRDLYFDTSFSYSELGSEHMERIIRQHGADKILFGTDSPWTDQAMEISDIKSLNLRVEETNMILGGNAKRLLKL